MNSKNIVDIGEIIKNSHYIDILNNDYHHLFHYYFPENRSPEEKVPSEFIGIHRIKAFISNYFGKIEGLAILDLGCGSHLEAPVEVYKGEGFSILAHMLHSDGAFVVGVDLNIDPEKVPFEAHRANIREIGEIIDSQFDAVICNRVLGLPFNRAEKMDSVECEIEIFEAIYKLTREKGILIISAQELSQERWECMEKKARMAQFIHLGNADKLTPNCRCSIFFKE